mgnify:CR=1 FL=1
MANVQVIMLITTQHGVLRCSLGCNTPGLHDRRTASRVCCTDNASHAADEVVRLKEQRQRAVAAARRCTIAFRNLAALSDIAFRNLAALSFKKFEPACQVVHEDRTGAIIATEVGSDDGTQMS